MIWRLEIHDSLPSTSDFCIRAAEAGEPEGLAVLALEQTQGRGSRGRGWLSPVGNLYLSVLLRPTEPAASAGLWSLLAAVALREALGNPAIMLKWPNDLVLDGGKLAGILLDSAGSGPCLDWLVIGFGANLAVAPDVVGRAVAAAGRQDAQTVAHSLLGRIEIWRKAGLPMAREAWLSATWPLGETIRLSRPEIEGNFAGVAEDGALMLERTEGIIRLSSGEVFNTRPSDLR